MMRCKEFDIENALAGDEVITEYGLEVRLLQAVSFDGTLYLIGLPEGMTLPELWIYDGTHISGDECRNLHMKHKDMSVSALKQAIVRWFDDSFDEDTDHNKLSMEKSNLDDALSFIDYLDCKRRDIDSFARNKLIIKGINND